MNEYLNLTDSVLARLKGPLHLRFIIQPTVAIFFAIRDGRKDAQENREPYFWILFHKPNAWREILRSSGKSIGKVFIVAILLDLIFQYLYFHTIHRWLGAIFAATYLTVIPYTLLRGPVNRLMQFISKK